MDAGIEPRTVATGALAVRPVPEIIDTVFAKTSPKRSFSMTEYERFGLVFTKTRVYKFGHWLDLIKKDRIKEATLRFGRRKQMSSSNSLSIHGLKKKHQFQDSNRDIQW
jgi:hypothetical protein